MTTFQQILQDDLNSGDIQVSELQNDLTSKGFDFVNSFEVENLFGTGKSGYVFQAEVNKYLMGASSIWVLTGNKAGEYRLFPVRDRWLNLKAKYHTKETITNSDFNNDGIPEIASSIGGCGHAACVGNLYLYEWRGNLLSGDFKNIFYVDSGGIYPYLDPINVWKFDTDTVTGKNIITAEIPSHNADQSINCYQFVNYYKFSWGNVHPEKSITPLHNTKSSYCDLIWAEYAAAYGHYEEATQVLASVLENWDQLDSNDLLAIHNYCGPAAQDYLRFKLGIWYIFGGQFELGRRELVDLRDAPANVDFPIVTKIVDAFLGEYLGGDAIDAACQAVIDLEEMELSKIPGYPRLGRDIVKATWGISDYDWWAVNSDSISSSCSRYNPIWTEGVWGSYDLNIDMSLGFGMPNQYFQAQSLILNGNYDEGEQIIESYSKLLETRGITDVVSLNSEYLYVTGLLYELKGEPDKAVLNYWQIWNDYPDSTFANIAKRKLILK